jgi:pyrimidine deaminase RibD-like protein
LDAHKDKKDYWGMVGACIIDSSGNEVYGVNHLVDKIHRDHAEVAAIKNYIQKYGKSDFGGAILVTTLSPCSSDIDQPAGRNCTDYLEEYGIKKVYCGWIDPTQVDTDVYKHKRFHLQETRNEKLQSICRKMAETFLKLD